jgi:sugar transferase (PEP-CTERM/EpsH1 system associated)
MPNGKIKILHVLDSLGVGGMERVLIDVANRLDPQSFEQAICTVTRKGAAAERLAPHVKLFDMGKGTARDLLMPFKLAKVMRAYQPDIVHTRSWAGVDGALAAALARKPKLVHSEHGRNLPYIHFEPAKRKVIRRTIYHLADQVFTVSEEMRQYFCRETGFDTARVVVVHNGIDLQKLDAVTAEEIEQTRAEYGCAPDDCVIGTVARFQETKDLPTLVRAFAQLAQKTPAKLLLVGDGQERAALESLARDLNIPSLVSITGLRHDVPRFLRAMDVFALPSLSEGLPGAVLEAMGAALPVVATNVGTLPELVTEGENGFLVNVKEPAAMAERLSRLALNRERARQFGQVGRRRVARDFSLPAMLQRYEQLYAGLVNRS